MNLDEELRGALHAHAEDAPTGAATMDGVRPRVRRLARRRKAGYSAAAAFVGVAVAITTPYVLASIRPAPRAVRPAAPIVAATGTSPTAPASPTSAAPNLHTTVVLAPPSFEPVKFPLTPNWTPNGLGQPTVGRNEVDLYLFYVGQSAGLLTFVGNALSPPAWAATSSNPTTVNGHPATISTGTDEGRPAVRITWQLSDRRWVDLQTTGLTANQAQRFADNLRTKALTTPLPFTLALAPEGYQVIFQEIHHEVSPLEYHFCLAAPGHLNDPATYLCVGAMADYATNNEGEAVTVGGFPARLTFDGGVRLIVHRPGFEYAVNEGLHGPLSVADLIRFAAGVAPA